MGRVGGLTPTTTMTWAAVSEAARDRGLVAVLVLEGREPEPALAAGADLLAMSRGPTCEVTPLTWRGVLALALTA